MSATYEKPGTKVNVLENTRILNLGETARITAIVSSGPTTRIVVDEAVQRSTGSVDNLAVYPSTGVSVSRYAQIPGVPSSQTLNISDGGNLYALASGSCSVNGTITWSDLTGQNVPPAGTVYYVSYVYDCPASQYNPATFSDKDLILTQYGPENTSTGMLSIGGSINLENGAPGVTLCQATGSTVQGYKDAIDKLLKKTNIEDIVILFASGSAWSAVDRNTVINYAISHLNRAAAQDRERGLLFGSAGPDYNPGGFDAIGDAATPSTYLYTAASIKSKNVTYFVPSATITRKDPNNNTMILDGNYIAAAVAGLRASRDLRSTPIHGFTLTGVTLEDEKWGETEMDQLGAGNCTVVESRGGVITIRDNITTDPTSADTQEPSVVDIERLVKRSIRNTLNNTYCNKGITINTTTPLAVAGTTNSVLQSLINDNEIAKYGQQDDPITGEVKTVAKQNAQEPRRIDVTCSYSALYPLKWIKVTVSVYI